MSRPLYETSNDLRRETVFVESLEAAWKMKAHKLGIKHFFDFACVRSGDVVSWLEVKERTTPSTKYDTYLLSFKKFEALRNANIVTGIPGVLAVRFTDCDAYTVLAGKPDEVKMGGRVDRGDPGDIEPVVHIPIDKFRRIG